MLTTSNRPGLKIVQYIIICQPAPRPQTNTLNMFHKNFVYLWSGGVQEIRNVQPRQYMQRAKIMKHAEITIDNKALCTHCRPMVIEFITIVLCAKQNVDKCYFCADLICCRDLI